MPRGVFVRSPELRAKYAKAQTGRKYSQESKDKISESLLKYFETQEKKSRYKTYGAVEAYGLEKKCQACGETETRICIHHIDGDIHNIELGNLMMLCLSCHAKLHYANGDYKRGKSGGFE